MYYDTRIWLLRTKMNLTCRAVRLIQKSVWLQELRLYEALDTKTILGANIVYKFLCGPAMTY